MNLLLRENQSLIEQAFVYLLLCSNGSLYCGWTNDPKHRLKMHQSGKGSQYTKAHLPVEMVFLKRCKNKRDALSQEFAIKHMKRVDKLALIDSSENLLQQGFEI